jgi:hypothetical protein
VREDLLTIPLPLVAVEGSFNIDPGPAYGSLVSELVREIRTVFETFDVPVWPSSQSVEPRDKHDVEGTLGLLGLKSGDDADLLRTFMVLSNEPHKEARFPIHIGKASDDSERITPEMRPGFRYLMERLEGRTTTSLKELVAIAEEWKANDH